MADGRCKFCGGSLRWRQTGAVFCSDACKQANYRQDQVAQAEHVIKMLSPDPVSDSARFNWDAITAGPGPRGTTWQSRLAYTLRHDPIALATFGESSIRAAAAPLSRGAACCRWALARRAAHVHRDKMPVASSVGFRRLLGAPCPACAAEMRAEVDARKPRKPAAASPPSTVLRGTPQHSPASCVTCHQARSTKANRMVITASLAPHDPVPPRNKSYCPTGCTVHTK